MSDSTINMIGLKLITPCKSGVSVNKIAKNKLNCDAMQIIACHLGNWDKFSRNSTTYRFKECST